MEKFKSYCKLIFDYMKKICKKCDGLGIINIKESYKIKLTSEKI